jgi:hypothetical protein
MEWGLRNFDCLQTTYDLATTLLRCTDLSDTTSSEEEEAGIDKMKSAREVDARQCAGASDDGGSSGDSRKRSSQSSPPAMLPFLSKAMPQRRPRRDDDEDVPRPSQAPPPRFRFATRCPYGCESPTRHCIQVDNDRVHPELDQAGWMQCQCAGCGPPRRDGARQCIVRVWLVVWLMHQGRCEDCRRSSPSCGGRIQSIPLGGVPRRV